VNLLGIDTSTASTAVALRLADGTTFEARDDPAPGAHPGHATRLLGLAHELLARGGVGWDDISRVAVGVGPGTFTGLRVGVATAHGIAQSLRVGLVGVSSTRALAAGAFAQLPEPGAVLASIDARRGEVFAAGYERDGDGLQELAAPRAVAPQDIAQVLAAAERWTAVGDGAVRYRALIEQAGAEVPPDRSPVQRVSAAAICELALDADPPDPLAVVLPDYRRRPDAELALQGATGTGP
jgi:tRNA threonylcarbamoyladenosine biosynthesis protein TsaB